MNKKNIRPVALDDIRIDGGTQPRAEIDDATVREYAEAMNDGAVFPPVLVYHDGTCYWLADGFHRYHAVRRRKMKQIRAEVVVGEKRDAILYSVGANAAHGLRRSNEDKRAAVMTLLKDAEWSKWSDAEIARQCNVDHKTVAKYRAHLGNSQDSGTRKVERGGTTYEQNTANIGRKSREEHPSPEAGEGEPQPPAETVEDHTASEPAGDTEAAEGAAVEADPLTQMNRGIDGIIANLRGCAKNMRDLFGFRGSASKGIESDPTKPHRYTYAQTVGAVNEIASGMELHRPVKVEGGKVVTRYEVDRQKRVDEAAKGGKRR